MITDAQNIIDGFYSAIKTSIGASIGNRVYELMAPQDATMPLCTYQVIANTVENGLTCSTEEYTVQVNVYGLQRLGSKVVRALSDDLFDDLNGSSITDGDVNVSNTVHGTEKGVVTIEDDFINIRQEYDIVVQ